MDVFLGDHCPHVGSLDDPQTHYCFLTDENICYATGRPEAISLSEQRTACLGGGFDSCPRFVSAGLLVAKRGAFVPKRVKLVAQSPEWPAVLLAAGLGFIVLCAILIFESVLRSYTG